MRKVRARAGSNVALLKYWGRDDNNLRLPANNSISITLDGLVTETSIEEDKEDNFFIDGKKIEGKEFKRIVDFLNLAGGSKRCGCRIVSRNSYPAASGLSSSASGFAALAAAGNEFFGLGLNEKGLSVLARKGSGSACRSIAEGFVRWRSARRDEDSFAETIFKRDYWELAILAVVLSDKVKETPTSTGHELARTSPYFEARMKVIEEREEELLLALTEKDFAKLGFCVEREMFEFHAIPMTSEPSLFYWLPETVEMVHWVRKTRKDGFPVFCTLNTGHNIFLFTLPEKLMSLQERLKELVVVQKVIENRIGEGAKVMVNE